MQSLNEIALRHPLAGLRASATGAALERAGAIIAAVLIAGLLVRPWMAADPDAREAASAELSRSSAPSAFGERETVVSAYAGAPWYYRSDVALERPDQTNLTLKRLGWDGDSLYFPLDGGGRVVSWSGAFGTMVDFLHNKAIARLGKGAHGRTIKNGVIETVETEGTLKGAPAPKELRLTDLFTRLEFTHGHNVLLFTGLARLAPITPTLRPYIGIGAGVAVPHVEVGFAGEAPESWTNAYQYAGPAAQLVAGIELRAGRSSWFIEYKFTWASISAALTGDHSWSLKALDSLKNVPRWLLEPFAGLMEMPGDLVRQANRWLEGSPDPGQISTHLSAHQLVAGGGYVWPGAAPTPKP